MADPQSSHDVRSTRVLFCAIHAEQARFFGDLARRLQRRGIECEFAVFNLDAAAWLRPQWGRRVHMWNHATMSGARRTPIDDQTIAALRNASKQNGSTASHVIDAEISDLASSFDQRNNDGTAPSNPHHSETGNPTSGNTNGTPTSKFAAPTLDTIGRYDAALLGWSDDYRRTIVTNAMEYWSSINMTNTIVIIDNDLRHWFNESAVAAATQHGTKVLAMTRSSRGHTPPMISLDDEPLRPGTVRHDRAHLNTPLWPLEQHQLAVIRDSACDGVRPYLHPRGYAFLPLPDTEFSANASERTSFVSTSALVSELIGALPGNIDLIIQLPESGLPDARTMKSIREVLRPGDRIRETREDDIRALVAGAALVVTCGGPEGIDALIWDRSLVVLGDAPYRGLGFTFDFDDSRPLAAVVDDARADRRDRHATARQERYLFELLCRNTIRLDTRDPRQLDLRDMNRLTAALCKRVAPNAPTADWSAVSSLAAELDRRFDVAVHEVLAGIPLASLLVFTSERPAELLSNYFEPHQITAPQMADEIPGDELRGARCMVYLPESSPAQLDEFIERLQMRGAAEVINLTAQLAQIPCRLDVDALSTIIPIDSAATQTDPSADAAVDHDVSLTTHQIGYIDSTLRSAGAKRILMFAAHQPDLIAAVATNDDHREVTLTDHHLERLERTIRRLPEGVRVRAVPSGLETGLPFGRDSFDAIVSVDSAGGMSQLAVTELAGEFARITPELMIHIERRTTETASRDDATIILHRAYWEAFGPVSLGLQSWTTPRGLGLTTATYRVDHSLLTILRAEAIEDAPPSITDNLERQRFISAERLTTAITDMVTRGYRFITPTDTERWSRAGQPVPPRCVMLTFDGGFRSVYSNAFPLLKDIGIKATVFIPASLINGRITLPAQTTRDSNDTSHDSHDLPCLTAAQLRELHEAGWTIGTQGVTGSDFTHMPLEAVKSEFIESRKQLAEILDADIHYAAISTNSDTSLPDHVVEAAKLAGLRQLFTSEEGFCPVDTTGICRPRVSVARDVIARLLDGHLPIVHRRTAGWRSGDSRHKSDLSQRVSQIVEQCRRNEWSRVALFGAGSDTRRLIEDDRLWPLKVEAVIDDEPVTRQSHIDGIPIRPLSDLSLINVRAVLIPPDQNDRAPAMRQRGDTGPVVLRVDERN